ncbi:hypothetical protein [Bdellovibrio sp. HCB2-146]|uniref:hypothetical protein n=1 Tax=Bdellovibrio sp. HCB2-146 TaxID=3394362 RepID=UPI0039BD087A
MPDCRKSLTLLLLFSLLVGGPARAVEVAPQLPQKHILPNSIQVRITPRGSEYFGSKLTQVLGNVGFEIDKGYFPAFTYTSPQPINPDDYAGKNPDAVRVYKQVAALLTQWLTGFSLNPHLPQVAIGDSGYIAEFSRFGLMVDPKLLATLGRPRGAVLAIEMEIKKLTAGVSSIIATDLNNDFLGQVGIEELMVNAASAEAPLKVRIPFYISLSPEGGLEFEVLNVEENIDALPIGVQYKKLIVPTFTVEMNGRKFNLNTSEVDRILSSEAPIMLSSVRNYLKTFSHDQLPELFNQKAKEFLMKSLEQVSDMSAPGDPEISPRPALKQGLILRTLDQKGSLIINLDSYVEDPSNLNSKPAKSASSRGAPNFALVAPEQYDVGLAVDRAVLNRAIQLGFERKNFDAMDVSGTKLRLTKAPTMDFVKTPSGVVLKPQETFLKLSVAVEAAPGSMFLKDKVVIEFDIIAKIRQLNDKKTMALAFYAIDEKSISMDDSYISWAGRLFKGKVQKEVRATLLKYTESWKTETDRNDSDLPLPPEIMGIQLDINRLYMDPNGHLIMFMTYAATGEQK